MTTTPARSPRVAWGIAAVTSVAFVLSLFAGPHIALQGGFIPARLTDTFPFPGVPFVLTPLSATLLHGSWVHLGFNMLMLIYCGRQVETALGGVRLVVLYVVGAFAAAVAQYLAYPTSTGPMIGASGAISAVVAAYAMMFSSSKVGRLGPLSPAVVRAVWLALAWIVLQWAIGLATAGGDTVIATAAHVGGFLAGLLLTAPLLEWRYRRG